MPRYTGCRTRPARWRCQGLEPRPPLCQHLVGEAGASPAGVLQMPLRIIVAEMERADAGPRAAWKCPPQHHHLLPAEALGFDPTSAAPRSIWLVALAYDALQPKPAGFLMQGVRLAFIVVAVPELAVPVADGSEQTLSVQQLAVPQIPPIQRQQIEGMLQRLAADLPSHGRCG
jgi:hypothetical protein